MPCNAVATISARLTVSPSALWDGEITAHKAAIERLAEAVGIKIWGMHREYGIRLTTYYGDVIIRADGTITAPASIAASMRQVINQYLVALARAKALAALRTFGRVIAEQSLPGGGVLMSLEV